MPGADRGAEEILAGFFRSGSFPKPVKGHGCDGRGLKVPVGMEANLRADAQQAKHEDNAFDRFHFYSRPSEVRSHGDCPGQGEIGQSSHRDFELLRDHQRCRIARRWFAPALHRCHVLICLGMDFLGRFGSCGPEVLAWKLSGLVASGLTSAFATSGLTDSIFSADVGASLEASVRPLGWRLEPMRMPAAER